MKQVIIPLFIMFFIVCSFSSPSIAEEKQNTIIKVGMDFEEADKMLETFGAKKVNLDIMPKESSNGKFMEVQGYVLGAIPWPWHKTPYIIINYEQENGKNVIRALSLYYYYYKYKSNPNNKWLDVEKIDLANIPPAPK